MITDERQGKQLVLFRQVAAERIARLNLAWIDFETKGANPTGFLREIHTLKGEAGLTGFGEVAHLAHLLESLVNGLRGHAGTPEQRTGDLVLRGLDLMGAMIVVAPGTPNPEIATLAAEIQACLIPGADDPRTPTPEVTASGTPGPSARHGSSVRIASDKIDRMRGVVADMLFSHQRCRRAARDLRHLRERALALTRSFEGQDERLSRDCGLVLDGLAGIEARLREDSYMLSRVVGELDSATRELRMTPLGTLLEKFPVPLRTLARTLGREVRLDIEGDQVEVDKTLLEMLEEPLLHLLRNAVDHGVEDPETRRSEGKPAEATVRVSAQLLGTRLHLRVSDDGAGIDVTKVRHRAAMMGLLDPAQAEAASDEQVMRKIFAAGFSTRNSVSEVSGRGIGLNVVLDVVEGLGGSVEVTSKLGEGTRFDLYAPISVAISRVVLFRVGMGTYALPASSVRALVETRSLPALSNTEGPSVRYQDSLLPLLDLGKVLSETRGTGSLSRIIIAQSGTDLVALSGSSEHLEREVVLRPMVKFFERQSLVTSAVSLEDGTLAVVLKAAELAMRARTQQAKARIAATQPMLVHGVGRTALVVDDSPVVRGIVADALRAYGLRVLVACDGEEALGLLQAVPNVDVVLTDMDMPRLDGLGLVRAIRGGEHNRNIPVIAISTRGNESEKRVALEAGVQAYIDKSDFNQTLLWQTVSPFVVRVMKIRVMIVDDSPLIRAVLGETFAAVPDLEVVGEAGDGKEAVEVAAQLRPDVITMDVLMPVMDGLEATERIMRQCPTSIVMVARDGGDVRSLAMEALARGALEVFPKPATGFDGTAASALAATVRRLGRLSSRSTVLREVTVSPGPSQRIRVLIVDDSPLVREILRGALSAQSDLEIVGEAADGAQAIALAAQLRPDLITMDLMMPIMGGTEATLRIMKETPAPILVLASATSASEPLEREALAGGALEVFHKPIRGFDEASLLDLAKTIRRMVQVARARDLARPVVRRSFPARPDEVAVVGIVGSTGAPKVLRELLAGLPADFPSPLVLVQHTERGFSSALVSWLAAASKLKVKLAKDGDTLEAGQVAVAGDDAHVEITSTRCLRLFPGEPVDGYRPSGTVLLSSLADTFGRRALGIVLSGMGHDGANGLGAIYAAGGTAVVEDPETAVVAGMPERALARATGAFIERGDRLAWLLNELIPVVR